MIIDCDGHVMETQVDWAEYLEAPYRGHAPRTITDHQGWPRLLVEGKLYPMPSGKGRGMGPPFAHFPPRREGMYDPKERIVDMDVEGIDVAVDFGTPVTATADGLVIHSGLYSGYGNLVIIYHTNGITTRYGHLSRITVEAGQRIKRGDQLGHAGSTGRSTGPHVHYEIRENDQSVDPFRYVGQSQP